MLPIQQFVNDNGNESILLTEAGYIPVKYHIKDFNLWIQTHLWCELNIGLDNYYFEDNTFWFNNNCDAIQFILRF